MGQAIVIFGSTGDLMNRKLIPAIDQLLDKDLVQANTNIYCVGRRDYDLDDYMEHAKKHVEKDIDWDRFQQYIDYIVLDINEDNDYKKLKERIKIDEHDEIIIYLAVPPKLFPTIAYGISNSGLIKKGDDKARVVFEKPFGEDLKSAQDINKQLWECFDESQIYRIDHYLGKEMIQNIMVVRFANPVFEHVWNKDTIESITILAKEKVGVLSRGEYYDRVGAINDMLQSHLLQMAALTVMDKPVSFDSEDIKDAKVKALNHITFNKDNILFGQYKAYKDSDAVQEQSNTDTFVYARGCIEGTALDGVPIHFITGKNLNEKRSEIIVHFKDQADLGSHWNGVNDSRSMLSIKVAPEEGVAFQFRVKEIGLGTTIIPATLDYCHSCRALDNTPEAYERLLLELIKNNRTLFTRWDEIEVSWKKVKGLQSTSPPFIYETYDDILDQLPSEVKEWKNDL